MIPKAVTTLTKNNTNQTETKIADGIISICRSIHINIDPENGLYQATIPGWPLVEADSIRSLLHQLTYALYAKFHSGSTRSNKDNNVINPWRARDQHIEQQLRNAIPHKTTEACGIFVKWLTNRTIAVVEFNGTRIAVPHDKIQSATVQPGISVMVQIPAVRPALSQGFCMIDGPHSISQLNTKPIRRLYLHLANPGAAAEVWKAVLPTMNELDIPYRTKALSRPQEYPRRDAIVFYLPSDSARKIAELFKERLSGSGVLEDATSMFAHRIGPGIALADEPSDPRPHRQSLSFGEHRSNAVADVAIHHTLEPQSDLIEVLLNRFHAAGIDPQNPAFNAVQTSR